MSRTSIAPPNPMPDGSPMAKKRLRNRQALRGVTAEKPVTPPPAPWDHGANGPANRHGLIVEPATEADPVTGKDVPNPNGVTRARRRPLVDTYLLQGKLTIAQANIARELRNAAEGARNADPLAALRGQIDRDSRAPDPQAAAFDARRKFHRMWRHVPNCAKPVIEAVVIEDMPITRFAKGSSAEREMKRLAQGLDDLRAAWARG